MGHVFTSVSYRMLATRGSGGVMATTSSRFSIRKQSRWRLLLPPLLVVVGIAAVLYYYDGPLEADIPRDADLCPVDESAMAGSTSLLVDFQKPLEAHHATLLSDLVGEIAGGLEQNHILQIFTLTPSSTAPRALVGRLCKPYSNAELQVKEAKDQRGLARDCDDLPTQLAKHVRDNARLFCARRTALQQRLDGLFRRPWPSDRPVASAYLVEAIEDMRLDLAGRPGPHALHLFSDMMQHAARYSHLDLDWTDWAFGTFSESLDAQGWALHRRRASGNLSVGVHYIPRRDLTDQPRIRAMHQQFWERYFEGTPVAFHDQPPMQGYRSTQLMNVLSEAEIAAQERAAAKELMEQIEQERAQLQREREELEARQQRQAEEQRERELQAQQLAGERQREQEEARQQELEVARRQQEEREQEEREQQEREREELQRQQLEEERQLAELEDQEPPQPEPAAATAATDTAATEEPEPPELLDPAPAQPEPTVAQSASPAELPPCEVDGPPKGISSPDYPQGGRWDVGDARMTVRYVLDEQGETVDSEVEVIAERSSAERTRYFRDFAGEAVRTVRSWVFRFNDPNDGSCRRRQTRETSFTFSLD